MSSDFVRAFEAVDLTEMHQARLALDAAGIPFVLEGERSSGGDWLTSNSEVVFRVHEYQVEQAKAVIWDFLGRPRDRSGGSACRV